ncbi:hypothetical protein [Thermosporothrix hazakensis]|uniref:hypothetical protein n=1 Tax=Thermosporothrix hazakensis TaxID=644383 RepID=UPI0010DB9F7E|nr:hypothetical protein [Thermosporothrix hazakensis]GCE46982.1 hypothetical protein KTH_18510 [Thermosporothrix hazakensis]
MDFAVRGKTTLLRRYCFQEETPFQLVIQAHDAHIEQLKQAVASLWLLTHRGGLGSRARRCGGNLVVQDIQYQGKNIQVLFGLSFTNTCSAE